MRILVTIPHFYKSDSNGQHSSQQQDSDLRIEGLTRCIAALHQSFGPGQRTLNIALREARPINQEEEDNRLTVIVCTTGNSHLLDDLPIAADSYTHHATAAEPLLLGFECHAVLRDHLGQYDYYCFLEDDLILRDPWFFTKLNWFNQQAGNLSLLQPNRFETSFFSPVYKLYVDGAIHPRATAPFQDIQEFPSLTGTVMGTPVTFIRPLNPHSGCFFLNHEQMASWVEQAYFLDRDTSFIGPLESAASLGIMKTFRIYKPYQSQANFLELHHFDNKFQSMLGTQVKL